ncbi:hypothetical protein KSP35_01640 [Aquihabitans sp. G128]|uniref:hypothetical protein n=1 Tax=Aquihabitans sp. G128 TaxID=2849779 RepID=UPI001C245B6C|nr:hypothetical protein [Aquihabitans sp. G128]QXC61578.1 hypothetical protein KSP35_01640 [Aquihabitans sp. G128]
MLSPEVPTLDDLAPVGPAVDGPGAWLPGVVLHLALVGPQLGRRDLFGDEAYSLAATHSLWQTWQRTGGTMALYYGLLRPWAAVSADPRWLRLPSALAMAAALAVLARLVARHHGASLGRWAGLVAAASWLPVRQSLNARSYGLVALLVAMAWSALDRVLDRGPAERTARPTACFAAATVLLPLAHGLAVVQVAALAVAVAWARPPARRAGPLLLACAASLGVGLALYVAGGKDVGVSLAPFGARAALGFVRALVNPSLKLAPTLALLTAWGAWRCVRGPAATSAQRFRQVALVLWGPVAAVAVLGVNLFRPAQQAQYAMGSALALPALLVVGVAGLGRPARAPVHRMPPILGAALLLTVLAVVQPVLPERRRPGRAPRPWWPRTGVRATASCSSPPMPAWPSKANWPAGPSRGCATSGPGARSARSTASPRHRPPTSRPAPPPPPACGW